MRAVVQRVTSASVEASQGGRTCSLQRCEQPHCLGAVAVAAAAAALGNIAVCLTRLPAGGWRDCGQDRAGAAVPGGAEGHGHRKGCGLHVRPTWLQNSAGPLHASASTGAAGLQLNRAHPELRLLQADTCMLQMPCKIFQFTLAEPARFWDCGCGPAPTAAKPGTKM